MLFLLTLLACGAGTPAVGGVVHHDAVESNAFIVAHPSTVVIDVRTATEFASGHVEGALNIDLNSPDFAARIDELAKGTPVLVHCAVGGRSTASLPAFEQAGFTDVHHMDGGLRGWSAGGFPVVK